MNTDLTRSELALAQFINDNIDLFANGFTDWPKLRAYCIQRCVEYGYANGKSNPIADACVANNVHRNFYHRSNVFGTAKKVEKYLRK